ncbi:MAG: Nramp family divalent metal transporter [Acidobacteriota bacterium]|nr:Nramp family divalent metal transporter [Acidobacteriota bacterium]
MASSSDSSGSATSDAAVQDPPKSLKNTLAHLGPGLVIAGSIVGSGELIATTKTGAQTGMILLWLILIGCVIKVFVQVELGRDAITNGRTSLEALNSVPGPRLRINWILWFWWAMWVATTLQGGGIIGGVGQAFALTFPLTGDYAEAIRSSIEVYTWDDKYWAMAATAVTIAVLVRGRYNLIQTVSTVLVASFTFLTLGNVMALQFTDEWRLTFSEVAGGLQAQLPRGADGTLGAGLLTALATFGIIGVGSSELVAYPYWCLEKGYARFTGRRSDDESWAQRARGWLRVLQYDVWLSMVVYTFATVAFFILGATVLHRLPGDSGDPEGMRMVATIAEAYAPVFGEYAKWLFLGGAIAVLYSTAFVGAAGGARIVADALSLLGVFRRDDAAARSLAVSILCAVLPLLTLGVYMTGANPVALVLTGGVMQAIMLPILGFGALYFRLTATDPRLAPGRAWDILLWLSCVGLLIAGGGTAFLQLRSFLS